MAFAFKKLVEAIRAGNSTPPVPSFYFNFSNPSNVTLGAAQARGNITSTQNAHITMSASLSRVVGVAPLYVNIDMTGTTSDLTANATHDLFYSVNWGDPGAGQWANGVQSPGLTDKNWSFGPVGGHVFETPGTYLVTPTSTDGVNSAAKPGYVTVLDPNVVYDPAYDAGYETICISSSNNFTGAPGTAGLPGVATYINRPGDTDMYAAFMAYRASNKRILFCKSDSWTCSAQMAFSNITNMTVGGYGTGVAATFGSGTMVSVSSSYAGSLIYPGTGNTDIKFCNLKIAASKDTSAIGMYSTVTQMLAYKIEIRGCSQGFNAFPGTGGANNVFDQHCMYECLVDDLYGYAFVNPPSASASGATGTPGIFTSVAHPFAVGYKVRLVGTPPAPLATLTDYYISTTSLGADTFTLSSSLANALAGTSLALSGAGTCTVNAQVLNGGIVAFVGFVRGGMMGCYFDACNHGEQTVRIPFIDRGHISNNYVARPNQAKNVLKIHSFIYAEVALRSKQFVVSANVMDLRGGYSYNGTTVTAVGNSAMIIGNGSGSTPNERVENGIVENNYTQGCLGSPKSLTGAVFADIGCRNMTVRNNIADFSMGDGVAAFTASDIYVGLHMVMVSTTTPEQTVGVRVYNNTLYSNLYNAELANFVKVLNPGANPAVDGVIVKNNLWYLPQHNPANTNRTAVYSTGSSAENIVATNNTGDVGGYATSPNFGATPPVSLTDWRPNTGSYAIDAGATVPALRDFNQASRVGGTYDLGAVLP